MTSVLLLRLLLSVIRDTWVGRNRQKQFATNSVTAIMTNVLKSALTWNSSDIDNVLVNGNDFYTYMRIHNMVSDADRRGYIYVDQLPLEHVLCNNKFRLEYLDLENVAMALDVAIQRAMLQADACLLTIRKNLCAVIEQSSRFAVFDPHARGDHGGWEPYGTSIDTLEHITNLV